MQVKKLFVIAAVAAVAVAAGSVFADEGVDASAPVSRQDVVNEVLQARAAGTLMPAGEAVYPSAAPTDSTSTKTLADSAAEVRQARADGTLRTAGEQSPEQVALDEQRNSTPSTLTRAEVKAEVIAARRAGELTPAGEAADGFSTDRPFAHAGTTASRTALGNSQPSAAGAQ